MRKLNNINESKIDEILSLMDELNESLYSILHRLKKIIAVLQEFKFGDVEKLITHYHSLISDIQAMQKHNSVAVHHLKQFYEELMRTSDIIRSEGNVRTADTGGVSSILESLDAIDEDCQEIIDDTREQAQQIASLISESSIGQREQASRADLRRKQLADALRKGEPIIVSQSGYITNSTADAIAALREQLAGCGETMVNSDGTVLNPYDTAQANVGFMPVDKAVVVGGDCEGIQAPDGKLAGGYGRCRICGTVFNQETNYCPSCGTKAVIEKPTVQLDKVFFSAVAPKSIVKGEYSMIDIFMYEDEFRSVVDEAIANAENDVKETKSGIMKAGKKSNIKVVLSSPDLTIDYNIEEQVWYGEHLNFSFAVELPEDFQKKQILFVAAVYVNDVIATRLKFIAQCMSSTEQKMEVTREDCFSAFVSYASQDRNRVAMIIQGMKKARPDMDIFFDVESLRSGDDWERALWHEIDKRDVLFLCWSKSARKSQWVDAEWRYALKQKGPEGIEPVPIDPPEVCPPPEELSKKHFNDKLIYIINSEYLL